MKQAFFFYFIAQALLVSSAFGNSKTIPSIEDFVSHPRFEGGQLSPSGKYLAVTRRTRDVQGILVINLETNKVESGTHFGSNEDVWDFFWANDQRLLIEPALRVPATMSYKAPTGELLGMDADGSNLRHLAGFRVSRQRTGTYINRGRKLPFRSEVFGLYTQDRDHVLVQTTAGDYRGGYSKALLLNINNGSTQIIGRSRIRFGTFIADATGIPKINVGANAYNENEIYFRSRDDRQFELKSRNSFSAGTVIPLAAQPHSQDYFVLENKSGDTLGLSLWQPNAPDQFKPVFRHPVVDVESVITDASGETIIALKFYDPLPNYYYLNDKSTLAQQHQSLRLRFPNRDVVIESLTSDLSKAVINLTGDAYPDELYLLDVNSGDLNRIYRSQPQLNPDQLAPMQPIKFTARDGLPLHGYLTLPPYRSKQQKLPLVVLVHGGPYGLSDQWGYDFEVQLLASRGYAVLQVNFRGSPGYGLEFQVAGIGEWGGKMQDDITDATRWVIHQGIVDPTRICIYGSSFGGYAALMGAIREPDIYQCAVGYSGIYDLEDLFVRGSIQSTARGESYLDQVLGQDEIELVKRSPYYQADKIRAKVLLAHGRKDNIAPYKQVKNMRKALVKAGNEPEYFIERREGHGFFGQESRVRYYKKLLAFLDGAIGE